MAVALEFIDLILPRRIIDHKYPGGWSQCLEDHHQDVGGCVWFDDHLFRDGAMHPRDMQELVERWVQYGFVAFEDSQDGRVWKDMCVVEGMFGGPTLPCPWIVVDSAEMTAHLAGTAPGLVVGPRSDNSKDATVQPAGG